VSADSTPGVIFVLVRTRVREVYGGERSTLIMAKAVAAAGMRTSFVVTGEDELARELTDEGIPFEVVPVGDPLSGLGSGPWRQRLLQLRRVFTVNAAVFGRTRREGSKIVHAAAVTGVLSSWLGAKLAGAKFVYHVRGVSTLGRTRWYEVAAILLADRTVAISDSLRELLVETSRPGLRGVLSRRIETVYNGFEFEQIDACMAQTDREAGRLALDIGADEAIALFVGGIFPVKGQLRFIEHVLRRAVDAAPHLRIAFVGGVKDAAYHRACLDAVTRLGLERHVLFTGFLPLEEVYRWYRAADLCVIASEHEGLSRTAVEAHAFGLPVVSTRVVGPVDVVRHGETGYLTDPARPGEMSEAVARLCHDPRLRRTLGDAGNTLVRARFGWREHQRKVMDVYANLLGTSRAARHRG
jgi:glycosyltransferase involved in cell wall biosynthesis